VPYTLLLADDSVTIQRVIELTFADEDVKVIAVSDGDQAIARVESSPPDIVLADIGMPGKNGYEVAKYIKQSPNLSHIPVVLLTGAFEPVDQARANEAGCDGVLAKPFEPQLVIGRVKDLLAKSSHKTPAASHDDRPAPPAAPAADRWDAPLEQGGAPSASATGSPALDDYFDRLDAAFQSLSDPAPVAASSQGATPSSDAMSDLDWFGKTDSSAPANESWDLPEPVQESAPEMPDLSLSDAPPSAFDRLAARPGGTQAASYTDTAATDRADVIDEEHPATMIVPPPPAPPPLAPPSPSTTPAAVASAPVATPPHAHAPAPVELPTIKSLPPLAEAFAAILAAEAHEGGTTESANWPGVSPSTDDLVDRVTRRVLDQLSDQVVRDAVSDIVSQIAERLVREEIERIKASVR
jgi:CheY-like chemotaxis protein